MVRVEICSKISSKIVLCQMLLYIVVLIILINWCYNKIQMEELYYSGIGSNKKKKKKKDLRHGSRT